MKAAIYRGVHSVDITNLPDYECGDDAVILKNIYSSICGTDVAVYNHGLTFGQKSLTGSGGYTPQDVRDVLNIMKSGKWDIEKMITHEYKLDELSEAIEKASMVDEALNVIINFN